VRSTWLAARARNALRRPLRIGGVSVAVFLTALVTLVLIPRQANRAARILVPRPEEYPDTMLLLRKAVRAGAEASAADSALAHARTRALRIAAADTLPPVLAARRDSLAANIAELTRVVAHAELSPLPAAYRAVASAHALRGEPRVTMLADSLDDIVRAREAFGTSGGVDPIFVALSARLNAIGRSLENVAEAKRTVMRDQIAALGGSLPSAPVVAAETLRAHRKLDSLEQADSSAVIAVDNARHLAAALDRRAERARELANVSAPPIALLAAALVLGAAVGFGVTFGLEVANPRVADRGEAERLTGARALAVLRPSRPQPERARRSTDRALSPVIDATSPEYRLLYLDLVNERAVTDLPIVTIAGDESEVVATVASNIAVAAVYDSRSTLLVDAEHAAAPATHIVGARLAPGVADVLGGVVSWADAITTVIIGRDLRLDVIPAGSDQVPASMPPPEAGHSLRDDLARLARRYDIMIVVAPEGVSEIGPASVLPGAAVVLCARLAYTTLERLVASVESLRASGMRIAGVALWDADSAPLTPRRIKGAQQSARGA
jgi:Mrp family chromosome partitioning ATPase